MFGCAAKNSQERGRARVKRDPAREIGEATAERKERDGRFAVDGVRDAEGLDVGVEERRGAAYGSCGGGERRGGVGEGDGVVDEWFDPV